MVLESDKASMEIPSPMAGVIQSIAIKVGDKVAQDTLICNLETTETGSDTSAPAPAAAPAAAPTPVAAPAPSGVNISTDNTIYASPGVRRLARELGIDLKTITASGEKGRITKNDLNAAIKNRMQSGGTGLG